MKIYDEITKQEITFPDLSKGFVYDGLIVNGRTEERYEVWPETITPDRPEGLGHIIPAQDTSEPCQWYHAYTEEDKQAALNAKIEELSAASSEAILAGMDVQLSDGSKKHFSYSDRDQANLSGIFGAISMGATAYPYHADGESCQMYSAEDIVTIYATLSGLLLAQNTYFSWLREYVRTLKTVPEINAVKYGDTLTGVYLDGYNSMVSQGTAEMQKIIEKVTGNAG